MISSIIILIIQCVLTGICINIAFNVHKLQDKINNALYLEDKITYTYKAKKLSNTGLVLCIIIVSLSIITSLI